MIARWVYLIPIFFTQPILQVVLEKFVKLPKAGPLKLATDLALISVGLTIAVPICCALYPQYSSIKVDALEPELKELLKVKSYVLYNKGL